MTISPYSQPLPGAGASDFDRDSGSLVERALFNNRLVILLLCSLVTVFLGMQATKLRLNASFENMIPYDHPFVTTYLQHRNDVAALGNSVRIAVAARQGTIYDKNYLEIVKRITDEVFLLPGIDRVVLKSLWSPSTRWISVTEDGLDGGPVIPEKYDGSAGSLERLRANIERSGEIGRLVAVDQRSSVVFVPLLSRYPDGQALDYADLGRRLEDIRDKYESPTIGIHITGFAKVVGDLIDGLRQVLLFFAVSLVITTGVLYWYTRCVRSTLLVVSCSMVAIVWQLGLLPTLGYELDPYSVLVPFLVFAIGMSHGAQKMNGIMQDIGRGTHKLVAARLTFRRLFLAGLTALLCDAVGFTVLRIIPIRVIQDLAMVAGLGVAVLIFTNLILLPILLSFVGVNPAAAERSLRVEAADRSGAAKHVLWRVLDLFTQRRWAGGAVAAALVLAGAGYSASLHLKIGDLDPGAPELRVDSRYNRDTAFMAHHYGASSDVFAILVKTPDNLCANHMALMRIDALEWKLRGLEGVAATHSLASLARRMAVGFNEGNPKWYGLPRNQNVLNTIAVGARRGYYNAACNLLTVSVYLTDHKADTLARVVDAVEEFAADNSDADSRFLLAAGNAGFEAATNMVVAAASHRMLLWVYVAVAVLCLMTFRSWRAVVCAVLPLALTSILCEALMVWLDIGVKVATLPVIALGVGIGVDYALYVMSVLQRRLRAGDTLSEAYYCALLFTGKVVLLTGTTLALSVAIWVASPIKFQADMGILLAFMFLWNMLGTLVLLPALAHFLMSPTTPEDQPVTEPVASAGMMTT